MKTLKTMPAFAARAIPAAAFLCAVSFSQAAFALQPPWYCMFIDPGNVNVILPPGANGRATGSYSRYLPDKVAEGGCYTLDSAVTGVPNGGMGPDGGTKYLLATYLQPGRWLADPYSIYGGPQNDNGTGDEMVLDGMRDDPDNFYANLLTYAADILVTPLTWKHIKLLSRGTQATYNGPSKFYASGAYSVWTDTHIEGGATVYAKGPYTVAVTQAFLPMCHIMDPSTKEVYVTPPTGASEATACPSTFIRIPRKKPAPPVCPKDPGKGNPIYPMTGTKRELVDVGISLAGVPLVFTYDSTPRVTAKGSGAGTALQMAGVDAPRSGESAELGTLLWSSSFHKYIRLPSSPSDVDQSIVAKRGDGTEIGFIPNGANGFTSPNAASPHTLVKTFDQVTGAFTGYLFVDGDTGTNEVYDTKGLVKSIQFLDGRSLQYTYSTASGPGAPGAGFLMSVADGFGRTVSFQYETSTNNPWGRINKVIDPAGGVTAVGYTTNPKVSVMLDGTVGPYYDELTSITWPDGNVRTFVYEAISQWMLTGIVDENASRYATFGYETNTSTGAWGYAKTSQHSGGPVTSISYTTPPTGTGRTYSRDANGELLVSEQWSTAANATVTNANGSTSNLSGVIVNGQSVLAGSSQPAGSGCGASTQALQYDAYGNISVQDDFDGSRSCFAYDSKQRMTLSIMGLTQADNCASLIVPGATIPANAAYTKTTWDANFPISIRKETNNLVVSVVSNGSADPFNGNAVANCTTAPFLPNNLPLPLTCKTVEQGKKADGTIDASTTRTTTFAYDVNGQVLSSTSNNGYVTSNTYYPTTSMSGGVGHYAGDVQSTVDPMGLTTTYNSYDGNGRSIQVTGPSGVVTTQAYSPRGWLTKKTVSAPGFTPRVTSFTYDAVGQMTKLTQPDGTSVNFTYDAAHRMVSTSDGYGNTVTKSFDASGNVISEVTTDASAVVKKTVTRSFDALNRLQSVTGAAQ